MIESLFAAFILGLMGSGHCLAMCGGITMALGLNAQHPAQLLQYHLGRIISYGMIGLLFGWLSQWLPASFGPWLRIAAALLMIAMAAYIGHWWRGLSQLEKLAAPLWQRLQPLARIVSASQSPIKSLMMGLVWGWLPCGMVYTALGLATLQGSSWGGALTMMAFGMGTLPTMLGLAWLSRETIRQWLCHNFSRQIFALLILAMALWTFMAAVQMLDGHG